MAAAKFGLGSFGLLVVVVVVFGLVCIIADAQRIRLFNVMKYGAVADGRTDNSQAFLKAWRDACLRGGTSMIYVPLGRTYMLNRVIFEGPCRGTIQFVIRGNLHAPTQPALWSGDHWITFRYVDGLVVTGGGVLDGQGHSAWQYYTNLPTSLRFDFVTNSRLHHIRSLNPKNIHINLYACKNFNVSHIRLTAPGDSHNTDGIHIGDSNNIRIAHSIIGTGDDCIAMVAGSTDIDIFNVLCGPGHGISVGSLGRSQTEYVGGISVRNCTFRGTMNGVRIKTWAPSSSSLATGFLFEDLFMDNVNNPVVIDQQYCPQPPCNKHASSQVQISDVTFKNIWGTSSSKVAVHLKCSALVPCQNVVLDNINLAYNGTAEGPTVSSCSYVMGRASGKLSPRGCL